MPTLDVYVYVTKHNRFSREDEDTLVHHVRQVPAGLYDAKSGTVTFGQVVEGLHGMDPFNVQRELDNVASALDPGVRKTAVPFLEALDAACKWCQWVRVLRNRSQINKLEESDGRTVVADLYQNDFRVVVKRDGVILGG